MSIFEGNFPVYFFFDDQRKLMLAPREYWVDINDVLVKELKNKLGNNNIIVKYCFEIGDKICIVCMLIIIIFRIIIFI